MKVRASKDMYIEVENDGSARLPSGLCSSLGAVPGQQLQVWVEGDAAEICLRESDSSPRRYAHWRSISEDLIAEDR